MQPSITWELRFDNFQVLNSSALIDFNCHFQAAIYWKTKQLNILRPCNSLRCMTMHVDYNADQQLSLISDGD
jgi:hypothetical protein